MLSGSSPFLAPPNTGGGGRHHSSSSRSNNNGGDKGRSPGSASEDPNSAHAVMRRIRSGDFRMDASESPAWRHVSAPARALVRGLLTVDPKKRLSLDDLFSSPWVKLAENRAHRSHGGGAKSSEKQQQQQLQTHQLLSPSVLSERPMVTERNLMQTYNAFHRATREGGLAQLMAGSGGDSSRSGSSKSGSSGSHSSSSSSSARQLTLTSNKLCLSSRRCKQGTKNSAGSSASSSGCSSLSSLSVASSTNAASLSPTKQHPWPFFAAAASQQQQQHAAETTPDSGNHFLNIRNSVRINDYLNSLSQIQQQQAAAAAAAAAAASGQSSPSSSIHSGSPSPTFSSTSSHSSGASVHPLPSEAISGVSYRLLPSHPFDLPHIPASAVTPPPPPSSPPPSPSSLSARQQPVSPPVSITPLLPQQQQQLLRQQQQQQQRPFEYRGAILTLAPNPADGGPVTRSRKRKMCKEECEKGERPSKKSSAVVPSSPPSASSSSPSVSITPVQDPPSSPALLPWPSAAGTAQASPGSTPAPPAFGGNLTVLAAAPSTSPASQQHLQQQLGQSPVTITID